jgi:pSer/pThr/pTyr-binding forkhead associated (FHA) protein
VIEITLTWLDGSRKGAVESFSQLPLRFGRADDCEVRFDADQDLKVSAKHAELRTDGGLGLIVEDLGSKNGTMLNGVLAQGPTPLQNHGVLQLGKDGPKVKVAFVATREQNTAGISFGAMRKQKTEKIAKRLATTDETPIYDEATLVPRQTSRSTLALAGVLVVLAVIAAAFFALRH